MARPLVFISYSHKDEEEKNQLVSQLKVLEMGELCELWVDDGMKGGGFWEKEIRGAIARADVAILLVSANYLGSEFIIETEIPELLGRDDLEIIPVIAKDCAWRKIGWVSERNARPKNGVPIWGCAHSPDGHLRAIAEEVVALITREPEEPDEPTEVRTGKIDVGRRMALVIANSVFDDDRLTRLAKPDNDASRLAEVLQDSAVCGFHEVQILHNDQSERIRREIARFFARKRPDDLLLLYYSGHGVRDDHGHLYLASRDTEVDLLSATAIPSQFIAQEMDRSRTLQAVLVLDCCHSGAFQQGAKGVLGSVGTAAAFQGRGNGRVVLTATDETQFAWEGDQVVGKADNSVFTHYLIEGMVNGKADRDGDGWITVDELFDYAYTRVINATPRQTPAKWTFDQPEEIRIARISELADDGPNRLLGPSHQVFKGEDTKIGKGAVNALVELLKTGQKAAAEGAARALKILAEKTETREALEGKVIVIPEGVSGAGRSADNAIVIDDVDVSREHFGLRRQGPRLWVTDLGSSNGTTLNDRSLTPRTEYALKNGDEIGVSRSLLFEVSHDCFLVRQSHETETLPDPTPLPVDPTRRTMRCCQKCRTSMEPSWKVCPSCGNRVDSSEPAAQTCSRCGTKAVPGWKACPACGAQLRPSPGH
ncbi:MAG: FHA domain-containing protein [bacterium]|nr:FHA domain-containing protein [bacterium]